ncbi:MAG: hypothetical protein IKF39_04180 [Oscillospiraceae bacterium]|nr:hypothetical protein [Solobacterium sp.]MBR3000175.1 hypothetical protein [Oscillospiraceae bacterium]
MENGEGKKTLVEFIKFNLVSFLVTILQLVLVNVLLALMKDIKTPLPPFLAGIFTPATVGAGNDNWGYVLPFFLSNAIANAVGYFVNRKTTFNSDSPRSLFFVFFAVLTALILFTTWVQGRMVFVIRESFPALYSLAPTIASFTAGIIQFLVLFPLEKYVLFRKES